MGIRAVVSTQTPLVRFKLSMEELLIKYGEADCVDVEAMDAEDYQKSPGGRDGHGWTHGFLAYKER